MGCYAEFKIGSVIVGHSKNYPDPFLVSLFQEEDKVTTKTTLGQYGRYGDLGDPENAEPITLVQLLCPASVARDRLEMMGFTLSVTERGFYMGREAEVSRRQSWSENVSIDVMPITVDELGDVTLKEWLDALQEIIDGDLTMVDAHDNEDLSPLIQYMLLEDWYGFPGHDHRHFLRFAIDLFSDDDCVRYDLTDLVYGECLDSLETLSGYLDEEIAANIRESRTIVVTEGHTDAEFLERSLKLLYPHLAAFFRFLDFETSKFAGGAGTLANMTKAFIGVGTSNRLIALFDNDTAAEEAIKPLDSIEIPSNILVIRYPHLQLAESYPTLGPSGKEELDVNGVAGSLELYLGEDCLADETGRLAPIQWKGYNQHLKKYQGEIINKRDVHRRFKSILDACEADPDLIEDYDWSGIRLIIDRLRCAFQEQDACDILEDTERY